MGTKSGDRIPEARFYTPVQTGLGTHPAAYTMGTGSHTSSAEVKERVRLYLYFPSGPSLPVLGVK